MTNGQHPNQSGQPNQPNQAGQPNQPHQPPPSGPNQPHPPQGNQSGGSSWWKWLLGCGCVGMLLLLCTGGVAVLGAGWYVTSTVQEIADAQVATQEQIERRDKLLNSEQVDVQFDSAVTASEFDEMDGMVEAWKNSEAVQGFVNMVREAERFDDSGSVWEGVQLAWQLWRVGASVHEVGHAYLDAIEDYGGMQAHYERFARTGAVVAAAHEIASGAKFPKLGDAPSDAVADLLYKKHDQVVQKYGSRLKKLRGKPFRLDKLTQSGELGIWALAQLPADSYAAWYAMSRKEREQFITHYSYALIGEGLAFRGSLFPARLGGE